MESGMLTRRAHQATSVDKSWKEVSSGHLGKSLKRSLAKAGLAIGTRSGPAKGHLLSFSEVEKHRCHRQV
jgi:hypothetical protein